jgi:hypothetical protein
VNYPKIFKKRVFSTLSLTILSKYPRSSMYSSMEDEDGWDFSSHATQPTNPSQGPALEHSPIFSYESGGVSDVPLAPLLLDTNCVASPPFFRGYDQPNGLSSAVDLFPCYFPPNPHSSSGGSSPMSATSSTSDHYESIPSPCQGCAACQDEASWNDFSETSMCYMCRVRNLELFYNVPSQIPLQVAPWILFRRHLFPLYVTSPTRWYNHNLNSSPTTPRQAASIHIMRYPPLWSYLTDIFSWTQRVNHIAWSVSLVDAI